MKKLLQSTLLPLFFVVFGLQVNAQTAGFNSTFAVLSINGGANTFYDLQAATANTDFNGANLGNFTTSNSLILKGAEHNVFKCGGCDLTSTRLYYRVYLTGTTPVAFSNLNIGFSSGGGNGCGGQDQQWSNTGYTTNILSGLAPGKYTFEVYSDASVTCLGGTVFAGNLGANYKANFNFCGPTSGPLPVGNYAIPGCFSSIASAVTYLNANGVTGTGTVQFDVAAGYTETAPTGGYNLNGLGTAGNLATGTATTAIVFKKSGTGANPTITAPLWAAGGLRDVIVKIIGGDYITFDGFTVQENPGNTNVTVGATNTMTEVGIGFFIASATNGAQFNTIQNCTVTLNSNFPNTVGIFSTSSSSVTNVTPIATSSAGTNSNNKIYSNTISNVAYGFYAISEQATATLNETGWDIGGTSPATGNTITFGNPTASGLGWTKFSSLSDAGIHFRNHTTVNVQYNTIASAALTYAQTNLGGVIITRTAALGPAAGIVYSAIIKNNIINLTNNGLQAVTGIEYGYGSATATIDGSNNTISIVGGATGASTGFFYGIKANYPSDSATFSGNTITMNQSGSGTFSGSAYFINSDGNSNNLTVQNNLLQTTGSHLKATGQFFGVSNVGDVANSVTIGGSLATANTITITRTGSGTFNVYGIFSEGLSPATSSYNVNFNTITISSLLGSNGTFGINNTNGIASTNKFFNNNTITLSGAPNGTTRGLYISNGTVSASNNVISITAPSSSIYGIDFSDIGLITSGLANNNSITLSCSSSNAAPDVRGITTSATTVTTNFTITNNTINSIAVASVIGSPTIHGIRVSSGDNNVISDNVVKNFSTTATFGSATVSGISILGGTNNKIFRNNINNLSSSSIGASTTLSAITVSSLTPVLTTEIYNNFISDIKAPTTSAANVLSGIACNALSSTFKVYHNTIKIGGASPLTGGSNFIAVGVGVNQNDASAILDLRNNIINMNVTPSGVGMASCVGFGAGTANAVPLGFAATSNNNIYSINSGTNNYLFVQGTTNTSLVNGYAVSGLTPNVANNINNDVNFNATCGLYKSFMGGTRELMTYNENNLVAGSPTGVFAPTGASFAENGAQSIATVTTDFNSVPRTPTNDIGALQFSGTTITFTDPSTTPTFTAVAPICAGGTLSPLPTTSTNGVTGTWSPALDNTTTTTYTFTPTIGQCATVVTLTITVIPNVTNTTTITACNTYTWSVNGTTYTTSGTYTNVVGCTTDILILTIQPLLTFYQDADGDGYGNPAVTVSACVAPVGYVAVGTDCNDVNPAINPAAIDICLDGIDNDCNGVIDNVGQPGGCILITTNVVTATCGAVINNLSVTVLANYISGAQGYRFRIKNLVTNVVITADRPVNSFALTNYPGITLATTYEVDVALRLNNVWQPFYGSTCTVTTPSPTTTLGAQCGTTLTSMTQFVYCNYVQDITAYRFRVTNTVTNAVQILDLNINRFYFNQITNRTYGTLYLVEIALRNTDGTYLPYGPGCNISTAPFPTSTIRTSQCNYTALSNSESIVANPVSIATAYRFKIFNTTLGYNQTIDRPINSFSLNLFSGILPGTIYSVQVAVRVDGIFGPFGAVCSLTSPGAARVETAITKESAIFKAVAYPNPFANNFKFDLNTLAKSAVQIKVYDMLGKLIESKNVAFSELENLEIGSNYTSGIYNVIVSQEDNTQMLRVIKR
jgi:Secretion system C-terminal sorting domain/Putative metal-binding motif